MSDFPMKWTRRTEEEMSALREKMARYESARSAAIKRVAEAAGVGLDMAALMVDKADAIRDALDPFDSGVRQTIAATLEPKP
jgi:ribosomal protein L7/L12